MDKVFRYKIDVDGVTYHVSVEEETDGGARVSEAVKSQPAPAVQAAPKNAAPAAPAAGGHTAITSVLPGNVSEILCKVGDEVHEGDAVLMIDAMKMASPVYAPRSGVVESIEVKEGDFARAGQTLIYLA